MKGSSLLGRLTAQGVTDPEGTWGVDKTAPGRGGGPGACLSEALGGIRARRGDGTGSKEGLAPSSLLESEDGARAAIPKMRITHAFDAKTHMRRVELIPFWNKRRDALPQSSHWLHDRPAKTRQRANAKTGSAAAYTPGATGRPRRIAHRAG